ncbi:MAG: EF-hand domain-containing protein [Cyanobacteria bacterium J06641_5]
MLAKVSERQMHWVRVALTAGWLLLTVSLFYDPVSLYFTNPASAWSPFRLDPSVCVSVQGVCLQEDPFLLGAPIFWGMIVPASLFILLVFGHEFWRRICPLSFVSQIPRALGMERKRKSENKKTGKVRYEIVKVDPNSWLAKNRLYLQLGLFFIGITSRILFVNSDRLTLGIFFLAVMSAAIVVGFLYGGKSWCHYFCPMAPVQKIYSEPRGLLSSLAHVGERQNVTQSMCRTVARDGKELSACVACNSPCLDIDAERHYWENIKKPEQQVLRYGYVGLAVGYFWYYYLYSGTFEYYFSGAWAHEVSQIALLTKPGFYIFEQAIPIPKFVAAPLTILVFGVVFYILGRFLENQYLAAQLRAGKQNFSRELARHRIFAIYTFFVFNYFYIFAGRNFVRLLPTPIKFAIPVILAVCSGMWLFRTWQRQPNMYFREGIASRLRKQLKKLKLNLERALEGRALDDLNADEVYVLAKTLPDFSKDQRLLAYKDMVREAIDEGFIPSAAETFERCKGLRQEFNLTDAEHDEVLVELGQESPELFDPTKLHSRENRLRLESYRESLIEKILASWSDHPEHTRIADLLKAFNTNGTDEASANMALDNVLTTLTPVEQRAVQEMRQEYGISAEDERDALHLSVPSELWHVFANRLDLLGAMDTQGSSSLQSVFAQLDRDRSGDISLDEMTDFFDGLGVEYSDEQVQEMLTWADTSGDRRICYDEFREVFKYLQDENVAADSAPTALRRPDGQSAVAGNTDELPTVLYSADDAPTTVSLPETDDE